MRDMDAEHITEALNSLLDRIEILENENLEMRVRISMLQKAQEKSEKNIITLSMITGKRMTKLLLKLGFILLRSKGSHHFFFN